ncbi:heme/hemin ABC transporter substrate-binding protein [Leifsonia poae]|uniref:heme/hemin ABC transporter substrate-binding protein n=1 Tax=Leifsonia poae TaxID=110933 RepID=UPI001CBABCAD|nr:ABC transporter substrate-binding protein [Leifsonia poae]
MTIGIIESVGGASSAAHGRVSAVTARAPYRSRRRFGRIGLAGRLAAIALAVTTLAGCGGTGGGGAPAGPAASAASVTPSAAASTDARAGLANPRTLTGPSTAATVADVVPIQKNPQPILPVTVKDATGASVTVTDADRILALDVYGTLAETVVGLGLGDRLVGRGSSNTLTPMKKLPLVTQNGHELNGEAILALHPTLILTDTTLGPREVQDQLRASGVTVVFFDPKRSIATIGPQVKAVAHAVGLDSAGKKLASRIEAELSEARTAVAALAPKADAEKLRVAFLYVRGRAGVFFLFGKGMGADDLIDSLGAVDVATAAGITGAKPANSEALLATNPDLLLTMTDGLASTGGVDGLLQRAGVADTAAGRHQRIVDMADGQVLSFGPTTPAVLRSLADAIYRPGGTR